jgi:hypothetical protein
MGYSPTLPLVPANVGIQLQAPPRQANPKYLSSSKWVPAFAGMSGF